MIDYESEIFNIVASAILSSFPTANVTSEYNNAPASFPYVSIEEKDNSVYERSQDDTLENHAVLMYETNIYSNKTTGKKAQCKAIAEVVDTAFASLNFTRISMNQIPNYGDSTIFRLVGRWKAIASSDQIIYRR